MIKRISGYDLPGVSIRANPFNMLESTMLHCSRDKKEFPNFCNERNGSCLCRTREFPAITFFSLPCKMIVNLSVVGSGPMLIPG